MAKKDDVKNILKAAEDAAPIVQLAATVVAVVASAVTVIQPAVDKIVEKSEEHAVKQRRLIKVPETYLKDYPKTLEQAIVNITEVSLKAEPSPVLVRDINIKYRDCFDNQVVSSYPRQNKKVEPETRVCLKYVTHDVIKASMQLFIEREEKKLSDKTEKEIKKTKQKDKNKKLFSDTLNKLSRKTKVDNLEESDHE